jgi:hypothetical protein
MTGTDGNRSPQSEVARRGPRGMLGKPSCTHRGDSRMSAIGALFLTVVMLVWSASGVPARSRSSENEQGDPLVVAEQGNQGGNSQGGNNQGGADQSGNVRARITITTPNARRRRPLRKPRPQRPRRQPPLPVRRQELGLPPGRRPRRERRLRPRRLVPPEPRRCPSASSSRLRRPVLPREGRTATSESGRPEAEWGRRGGCGRGLG